MKRFRKFLRSPQATLAIFAAAILLLLGSSVGGARAALTYFSETYSSRVQMYDIGVSLLENGERVSWRNYNSNSNGTWDEATGRLLANMLAEGQSLQIGRTYPEVLSVQNSGTINQYVRVNIYKYWVDARGSEMEEGQEAETADGRKIQALSPDLIDLNILTGENGWILDREASTRERTVLYYGSLLDAGEETPAFTDTLTIDGVVAAKVSQEKETTVGEDGKTYTTITTTYDYDGVRFCIEAEVDAVQEHNAEAAALSAWGRSLSIQDGVLSLD